MWDLSVLAHGDVCEKVECLFLVLPVFRIFIGKFSFWAARVMLFNCWLYSCLVTYTLSAAGYLDNSNWVVNSNCLNSR